MLKKTVTYDDPFTGATVNEDLYFNITKAELVEMEMSLDGGLKAHLEGVAQAENGTQIMQEMKGIILKAYGVRTPEGKFIKNDKLREEFESSEAYSTLFMEMVTDADVAVEFAQGIMPKDLADTAQDELPLTERMANELGTKPVKAPNLSAVEGPVKLTRQQAFDMDDEQLRSGLAEGRYILVGE